MPRKSSTTEKLIEEIEREEQERERERLDAVQPGSAEIIDVEKNQIELMMDSIAGVTDGEVVYWLHRASEKNKMLHGNFLMRYPKETPLIDIVEQARDKYHGGDFVLLAKKDGVLFRKAAFTCERAAEPEVRMEKAPEDPFNRLSSSLEKALIIDRTSNLMRRVDRGDNDGKSSDPMIALMTIMMNGMRDQNTMLQKMLLERREAPEKTESSSLLEAIKLGSALSGGKLPIEEGEGGLVESLKSLVPYIPQVLSLLTGRKGAPPPGAAVGPKPLPLPAHPSAAAPTAETPTSPAPPVQDARAVIMARVLDEIKFVLSLSPSPKAYEHVVEYIETYAPDILQQAELTTPELFSAYVVTLDPSFIGREDFFIALHKHYMAGLEGSPDPGPIIA